MSSCIRRYSQVPEGVRFFVTLPNARLAPYFYYSSIPLAERLVAVTVPYTYNGNIVETTTAEDMRILYCGGGSGGVAGYGWLPLNSTERTFLLKDLGQTIDFKVNGLLAIQWRLVQLVSGPITEGAPPDYPAGGEGWVVTYLENSPNNPGTSYYQDTVGVMRVG